MAKFYAIETLNEIATSDRNDTIHNHKRGEVLFSCEYVRWFDTKKERDAYVDNYDKQGDRVVDEADEEVSVQEWSARTATAREAKKIINADKYIYGV